MEAKLGQRNLFVHFNQSIPLEPIAYCLNRLAQKNLDQHFVLLTDSPCEPLGTLFGLLEIQYVDRSSFIAESAVSGQQKIAVDEMNELIDEVENKNFDQYYQLGRMQWGNWLTASLQPMPIDFVNLPMDRPAIDTMNRLNRFFGLKPEQNEVKATSYCLDLESLPQELKQVFAGKEISNYCPWLQVDDPNKNKESAIITCDSQTFHKASLQGRRCLYLDSQDQSYRNQIFLNNQFCLDFNGNEYDPIDLFNALSLWKNDRLHEHSFVSASPGIEFTQVINFTRIATLQSTRDLNQEFRVIQDMNQIYRNMMTMETEQTVDLIEDYLKKIDCEKYLVTSALYSMRYLAQSMEEAAAKEKRIFENFGNDYYKLTIAHEILESIMSKEDSQDFSKQLPIKLDRYIRFFSKVAELVDTSIMMHRKQGE